MEEKEYDEISTTYEEVKTIQKEIRTDSYFDGKFIEYLGYKLLAFLITVVTLTIAKPWADKLILDYKINHTVYNGKRLRFEGKGTSLFVQRFKWVLLTIITLGIYSFWIPIKQKQWIVSNIHFEDEEFNENESIFDGKLIQLIGINLFTYLLTLISFGLLFPFTVCYKLKWEAKHTIINRKKIVFNGKTMSLIGHYLLWWLLSIITFGIYGLWLPMKVYGWQVKNTHIKLIDEEEEKNSIVPAVIGVVLFTVIIIILGSTISKMDWESILPNSVVKQIYQRKCESGGVYRGNGLCYYREMMEETECNTLGGEYFNYFGEQTCKYYKPIR